MKINFLPSLLFLSLFLLFSQTNYAQKAIVKGMVTDAANGEANPATIKVLDEKGNVNGGTIADIVTGAYQLELSAGKWTLTFGFMGMETQKFTLELAENETKELSVQMTEEINPLREVTVTGSKSGTELARNTVSIDVVKPALVDNINATKVDEVVDKVPGVNVVDGQANIRGGAGYSYGAGSRVLILVDDLPFMAADAGYANWRDIPVENIDQIEVLKGAASAMYGSSALNGIINIRTGYAKSKPETKISIFQTSFMRPRDRMIPNIYNQNVPVTGLAWWAQDSIRTDVDFVNPDGTVYTAVDTTFKPQLLSGPLGYRKPIEMGFSFGHKQKFGKFDMTIGGYGFWKDSYLGGEYERKIRVNGNFRYRITDSLHIGVNVNFNYGKSASFFLWGNSNYGIIFGNLLGQPSSRDSLSYFTLPGTITASTVTRFNVDPFVTYFDKFSNRHRLQTRIYYVNNQNANNQGNQSTLYYGEYQYQRQFKQLADIKVVAGFVAQYSYINAELYGNASYELSNIAGYLQLDKGFFKDDFGNDKLNFSFGMRLERNTIKSPNEILVSPTKPKEVNPNPLTEEAKPVFRAGVNYAITPFTFVRASWGQGYRYPTVAERYITTLVGSGSSSLEIRANPKLQSETGWSAEIGIKQGFMITRNWKGFVDLSGFWTEYQNMMEFTFGGGDTAEINRITLLGVNTGATPIFFQSANIGNTKVLGAELSLMGMGKIGPVDINIMAGYTYIDPKFQDFSPLQQTLSSSTENILKYRSRHNVKFDIEAFFLKKNNLSVGFSLNYNSSVQAIDRVFQDLILADNDIPFGPLDAFGVGRYRKYVNDGSFVNLGARIGYRQSIVNKEGKELLGLKFSIVGKNMLNQEYNIRPGLVGAPMNITIRLDVEF